MFSFFTNKISVFFSVLVITIVCSCTNDKYDADRYQIIDVSPSYLKNEYIGKYIIVRDAGSPCLQTFFDGCEDGLLFGSPLRSSRPFVVTRYKGEYLNWFSTGHTFGYPEYRATYAYDYRMSVNVNPHKLKGTITITNFSEVVKFSIKRIKANEIGSDFKSGMYADVYTAMKAMFKSDYIFRKMYVRIPGIVYRSFPSGYTVDEKIIVEAYRDDYKDNREEIHDIRWSLYSKYLNPFGSYNNALAANDIWNDIPNSAKITTSGTKKIISYGDYTWQEVDYRIEYKIADYYFDPNKNFMIIPGHETAGYNERKKNYWQSLPRQNNGKGPDYPR